MKKSQKNILVILLMSLFCLTSIGGVTAREIDGDEPVIITGIVTASDTGDGIIGASLKLYCGGGQIASATSGSGGSYSMTLGKTYSSCVLQCSFIGYFTADVGTTPYKDRIINFPLNPKIPTIIEGNDWQKSMLIAHDPYGGIPEDYYVDNSFIVLSDTTIFGQSRAFTSIALQPIDYYKTSLGYRSIEFALDIKNYAEVDVFNHGDEGHILYTDEQPMPPTITDTKVTMDLYGSHDSDDSIEVAGATSTQHNHRYKKIDDLGYDNVIDDPQFLYPSLWTEYNPSSANTITISNGFLTLENTDYNKMYVKEYYTTYFNTPQRYISAYFEGCRDTSSDYGTTVGLDLKLTLANGVVKWFMPSELRMAMDDTTWQEHHVFLDAVAIYGSPVEQIQAYCLNYEKCNAYMDRVYAGATYWDLTADSDNPEQTDNYAEWTAQQAANEAFNEQKDTVVQAAGMLGKVLGYVPNPIAKAASTVIQYGCMILGIANLPVSYWEADGTGQKDCWIHYDTDDTDYRASSAQTTFYFHVDLDKDSTGTRSVQFRIKSYYEYGDDYQGLANTFEVENVITLNFLDYFY